MIRMPVLMDGEMAEAARLAPTALQVDFKLHEVSQATMTLPEDGPAVNLHDWITLYGPDGSWGVWRVTNIEQTLKRQRRLTLMHGIDVLADSLWEPEEAGAESETFTGNTGAFLSELLSKQTHLIDGLKPWALRDCESQEMINGKEISYDNLAELLQGVAPAEGDYYLEYDMSVFPWRVALRAKPQDTACEFRLARNISSCAITYNDADLCTRLVLSVTSGGSSQVRIYTAGAAAEAEWGVVTKPASIDTHDDLSAASWPEAEAWVRAFFAQHAQPTVQIQIEGRELARLTGDSWDRASLGKMCRVALPDYGHTFTERVVAVTYPDPLRDPERVTVSLANTLPSFTDSIRIVQRTASGAAGSARKNKQALDNYSVEFEAEKTRVRSTVTAIGVVLNPDGSIATDPATGEYIFSPDSKVNLTSQIIQNAGDISSTVTRTTNLEGRVTTAESRISQTEHDITLKVSKGDVSTQLAVECGNVSITGGDLVVDGMITAAYMAANSITVHGLTVDNGGCNLGNANIYVNAKSLLLGVRSMSVSGDTLTWYTFADDNAHTATFSRAATIEGAWSSGAFTVSAVNGTISPSSLVTSLTNTGHWGVAADDEVPTTYYGATKATIGSSSTILDTGNTFTIDASGIYNLGHNEVTGGDIELGGASSQSGSVTKGKSSVSGYIWLKKADGTYSRLRSFSIGHSPTAVKHKSSVHSGSIQIKITYGDGHYATVTSSAEPDQAWNNLPS